MENVENKLRELREANHLTLVDLKNELKKRGFSISSDALSKYERGDREPKLATWKVLADYYSVPVWYVQGVIDLRNSTSDFIIGENGFPIDSNGNFLASEETLKNVDETMEKLEKGINNVKANVTSAFFDTYKKEFDENKLSEAKKDAINSLFVLFLQPEKDIELGSSLIDLLSEISKGNDEAKEQLYNLVSYIIDTH